MVRLDHGTLTSPLWRCISQYLLLKNGVGSFQTKLLYQDCGIYFHSAKILSSTFQAIIGNFLCLKEALEILEVLYVTKVCA